MIKLIGISLYIYEIKQILMLGGGTLYNSITILNWKNQLKMPGLDTSNARQEKSLFVTTWMDIEIITPSEISQKIENHIISLICGI